MNETDDAILEYLVELEAAGFSSWQSPTAVYLNVVENLQLLDKSKDAISRRMGRLEQIDLLKRVDEKRGYYQITELGIRYVNGELDIDDIPHPDDDS